MLERWRERDVFARSVEKHSRESLWSFYEGPPTANGRPHSGHVLSRLQGHLPALPHDDRAPRAAQGGLGLPRAAGRARGREGAGDLLEGRDRGVRDRGVQRALPRVGLPLRGGVEPADRADRVLDRPRRPLRDDGGRLHRVWLVGPAADVGRRAAVRGPQGRALLPALRHRAQLARGRPRLPRRRGPLRLREAADPGSPAVRPDPRVAAGARRPAAGLDDHALDPDLERRGRGGGRDRVRAGPRGEKGAPARSSSSLATAWRRSSAKAQRSSPTSRARPWRARATSRPSATSATMAPAATRSCWGLRHHRGRHGARPHRRRLRRGRLPARRGAGSRCRTRSRSRARSTSGSPTSPAARSRRPTPT